MTEACWEALVKQIELVYIIYMIQTIILILIVILTMFQLLLYSPAFYKCRLL